MSSEDVQGAARIWSLMQRDPAMLGGLVFGQLEELVAGIAAVMQRDEVRVGIKVGTLRAAHKLSQPGIEIEETLQGITALLEDRAIRDVLDEAAEDLG